MFTYLYKQLLGLWYLHIYTVGTKDLKSCKLLRSHLGCRGFSLKKGADGLLFALWRNAVGCGNRLKH